MITNYTGTIIGIQAKGAESIFKAVEGAATFWTSNVFVEVSDKSCHLKFQWLEGTEIRHYESIMLHQGKGHYKGKLMVANYGKVGDISVELFKGDNQILFKGDYTEFHTGNYTCYIELWEDKKGKDQSILKTFFNIQS